MRLARILFLLLFVCCKPDIEVVKAPERPKEARPPVPEASPEVEASMIQVCSRTSQFGTKRASEALQMPMRWVNPQIGDSADCTMGPPEDTRPYFWTSVLDTSDSFDNFTTADADTERDRDIVNPAKRVAWVKKEHRLVAADDTHLVIITMDPNTQQSSTAERMNAANIAAKLLFALQ
jgi:hypothetical protein